jgi:hypothetical protein
MAANLNSTSDSAQDIGSALLTFQRHLHNFATEITALISELFAISSAILELQTALLDPRFANSLTRRNRLTIEDDKGIVIRSLEYTFNDIYRFLGDLSRRTWRSDREAYMAVWQTMDDFFREESRNTLLTRLEYYRSFLDELGVCAQGYEPSEEYDTFRDRIEDLEAVQKGKADMRAMQEGVSRLTVNSTFDFLWTQTA